MTIPPVIEKPANTPGKQGFPDRSQGTCHDFPCLGRPDSPPREDGPIRAPPGRRGIIKTIEIPRIHVKD